VLEQPRPLVVNVLEDLLQCLERARLRLAHALGQPVTPAGDVEQHGLKAGSRRPGPLFLGLGAQSNYPLGSHRGVNRQIRLRVEANVPERP
jgi:hypothetical protein